MPVQECQLNNKPGYKWGEEGKCYTYTPNNEEERNKAKEKAIKQGIAIGEYEGGDSKSMKTVQRYEEAEVLDYVENEEDGFLTVEIAATRTGVMPYYDFDTGEVVMELKPPEEIFSDVTMESLKGVPVTDRHPPVMVDTLNWKDFTKGTTHLDVRQEDNLLVVNETLFDDNLIAYVKSGKKAQVSIGFRADLDETSGEFEDEKYDRIQRNIRINHVAHVEQGRAGSDVGARLDSKDNKFYGYSKKEEDEKMEYAKVENFWDSLGVETAPEFDFYAPEENKDDVSTWLDEFELPVKEVEVEVEKEDSIELEEVEIGDETISVKKEDKDKLVKVKDKLEGKMDSKDDKIKTLEDRIDELEGLDVDKIVQDRLDLVETVKDYMPKFDSSGKSEREIKTELIQKLDEDFEPEEKSDEYINARFDGALKALNKIKSDSFGENNLMFKKNDKKDDKYSDKKKARLNMKK
ncbi:MAG: DUF2213 domain-containing protein [Clostridia bacterium]